MKAVFVIDVDKEELGEAVATITAEENDITFFASGFIRPLPNRWYEDESTSFANGIARGFNKCIDAITGETE